MNDVKTQKSHPTGRLRGLGNNERNVFCVKFEDMPPPLPEHGSNQDVGVKHQLSALHADYFEIRFFSRPARRISL